MSGTRRVDSVLTVAPRTWIAGTRLSYRWLRNEEVIPGATAASYKRASEVSVNASKGPSE